MVRQKTNKHCTGSPWWSIASSHYRVYNFIAYIYMQKLPPEINSIYAYVNPIVAVLGAVILAKRLR
jgi:hypothetical protein